MLGQIGHIALLASFIISLCSVVMFFCPKSSEGVAFAKLPRIFYILHTCLLFIAAIVLFTIIFGQKFEYHYAWAHSSKALPLEYIIACFWEGQEGSFLTWVILNSIVGLFLLSRKADRSSNFTLGVFMLIQTIMISMSLGVELFGFEIGASPFDLLKERINLPIFTTQPNYIPADGNGLNPLLQNYWMVIHPPTIFLGFALTLIPFSLATGHLLANSHNWIKQATPWVLTSCLVLSAGIVMGAYWAYETLNFGGYWNWDPVENAVYVPWLMWIAVAHLMVIFRKNKKVLRTIYGLTFFSYTLIIYSTFLTRSGILGDSSVHSFTDSGLFAQLTFFVVTLFVGVFVLMIFKWKTIPSGMLEEKPANTEFWIFIGVIILSLASFQVLLSTSVPVFNSLGRLFSRNFNIAPPSDALDYYTKFQYYFALLFCLLSIVAQYIFWFHNPKTRFKKLIWSSSVALSLSSFIYFSADLDNIRYFILLACTFFTITSASQIIFHIPRQKLVLSGGSISHIGMAISIIGILFSSAYATIISKTDGFEDSAEASRNKLFMRNKSYTMGSYDVSYKGQMLLSSNGEYIPKELLYPTLKPGRYLFKNEYEIHSKGDTIHCTPHNIFYKLDYETKGASLFSLYPRIQMNPKMGVMASPAIRNSMAGDIYTHVSNFPNPGTDEWISIDTFSLRIGETDTIHGFPITLARADKTKKATGIYFEDDDLALDNTLIIDDQWANKTIELHPIYQLKSTGAIRIYPDQYSDPKIKVTIESIDTKAGIHTFKIAFGKRDWVVLKSIEKPLIGLVWIGGILVTLGFGLSIFKTRITDKTERA